MSGKVRTESHQGRESISSLGNLDIDDPVFVSFFF